MGNRSASEEDEELTEEQRIAQLEKSVSSNKVILLIVGLILIITISVAITTGIITALTSNDENTVKLEDFQASQAEIEALKKWQTWWNNHKAKLTNQWMFDGV